MFVSLARFLDAIERASLERVRLVESGAAERDVLGRALEASQARNMELERTTTAQQTVIAFLSQRVNQLEAERVSLLRAKGIDVPDAPVITPADSPAPRPADDAAAFGGLNAMFEDMGDAEAKRRGASWDVQGRVQYGPPSR